MELLLHGKMTTIKDNVLNIVVIFNIKINVSAGTDILKTITVNVNLYAKKDINLIISLKLTVKRFAHGTIFIKENGISV